MITKNNLADIPPNIAQLPLRLSEKVALHFIHRCPDITNDRLAQLLGMRPRGTQDMLRRLRQLGYIVSHGKGRARQLELMFPVERHAKRDVQIVE
jgi:DNA-binding MarR family transcriptional regulator